MDVTYKGEYVELRKINPVQAGLINILARDQRYEQILELLS